MPREVDPTHVMSEWKSSIISTANSDRFGELRKCVNCEAEQAKTVTGTHTHPELFRPCTNPIRRMEVAVSSVDQQGEYVRIGKRIRARRKTHSSVWKDPDTGRVYGRMSLTAIRRTITKLYNKGELP